MKAGPRAMYMQQQPAFEARSRMVTDLGPSTETSPPVFTEPDIEGLKNLKKQVVENLPTHCSHCNADMLPDYCCELKDGSVMAYCKKPGACGKSLVLFAGVDLVRPVYRKICPFKKVVSTISREPVSTPSTGPQPGNAADGTETQLPTDLQVPEQQIYDVVELYRRGEIDEYDLHGISRPTDICALCSKRYDKHEHTRCDENGWVHDHDELLPLPNDWPRYDRSSHRWVQHRTFASIFGFSRS